MKRGFATLAIVGAVAAIAVFALSQGPSMGSGMNLKATDSAFTKYLAKHGKSYVTKEEYELRRAIFEGSIQEMNAHNAEEGQTWFKAINQFSDMTPSEIEKMFGGGIEGEEMPKIKPIH